ncbi:MAG TPA: fluoride efflux transporter CrcB [Gemmatimonadales bacterium]|nr:fluoride efflux transporter CrcB [Gemmatimonadales bacterium]
MPVYIAIGSAIGGLSRYWLGGLIQRAHGGPFPLGTLVINVTGSLLIGFLLRYSLDTTAVSAEMRGFLTIGFCGGYTTFSTFSWETVALIEDGDWRRASLYILASVILSIAGTIAGVALARQLIQLRHGA